MALRNVQMCDAIVRTNPGWRDGNGDPTEYLDPVDGVLCELPAKGTCALCRADRCASHLGEAQIRSHVSLSGVREKASVLGAQEIDLHVCVFCVQVIFAAMNRREHTIRHVIKTDSEEILSAIRARLTEKALEK